MYGFLNFVTHANLRFFEVTPKYLHFDRILQCLLELHAEKFIDVTDLQTVSGYHLFDRETAGHKMSVSTRNHRLQNSCTSQTSVVHVVGQHCCTFTTRFIPCNAHAHAQNGVGLSFICRKPSCCTDECSST